MTRRKLIVTIMLVAGLIFCSCGKKEDVEMTDRQEEIFRAYGLSDEEIVKMNQDGLSVREESFANTAIIMLDHLKEKYNEEFEIVSGGGVPDLFSEDYWINAQACEGEYADVPFEVSFNGKDIQDGYMAILKNDEACKVLNDFIHKKNSDVLIYADIYQKYRDDEVTADMSGDELMHAVTYSAIAVIVAPDMSEAEFQSQIDEISLYLRDNDVRVSGSAFCFSDKVDSETTESELMEIIENSTNDNQSFKWSHYVESY